MKFAKNTQHMSILVFNTHNRNIYLETSIHYEHITKQALAKAEETRNCKLNTNTLIWNLNLHKGKGAHDKIKQAIATLTSIIVRELTKFTHTKHLYLPYLSTFVHKGDIYLGHSELEKHQGAHAYPSTLKKT